MHRQSYFEISLIKAGWAGVDCWLHHPLGSLRLGERLRSLLTVYASLLRLLVLARHRAVCD